MGYKSPEWGYPNDNLLITLLSKSHEPLSMIYPIHPSYNLLAGSPGP